MGFLGNPIKKIGGALSKLPGAKTLNKPMNKLMGQTPGLKGVPQKLGMAGPAKKPASPIGPSPAVPANAMAQGKLGAQAAPPMQQGPNAEAFSNMANSIASQFGQARPQPMMQEAPEAQPGMQEMASLAAPSPQGQEWGGGGMPVPQQQPMGNMSDLASMIPQQQPQVAQQPNPQMGGQMNPMQNFAQGAGMAANNVMNKMKGRNTGVAGGMKQKIGPSWMG